MQDIKNSKETLRKGSWRKALLFLQPCLSLTDQGEAEVSSKTMLRAGRVYAWLVLTLSLLGQASPRRLLDKGVNQVKRLHGSSQLTAAHCPVMSLSFYLTSKAVVWAWSTQKTSQAFAALCLLFLFISELHRGWFALIITCSLGRDFTQAATAAVKCSTTSHGLPWTVVISAN